jgi:hypothetical protein
MKQVTQTGGFRAAESVDRQTLYFTSEESETSVWEMPVNGGNPARILGPLYSGDAFQVLGNGIYAVIRNAVSDSPSLVFYSFASRRSRPVATLDRRFDRTISVSANGRWLVYDALRYRSGDLMMIEGLK